MAHQSLASNPAGLAIKRQNVEGIQLDAMVELAEVQAIEIGDAVEPSTTASNCLRRFFTRGLDDPQEATGDIVAAARSGERAFDRGRL